MKFTTICIFLLFATIYESNAQVTRYLVKFRNKGDNSFSIANPSAYLSARSIARRTRYSIPIDSTDLPVTSRYLDSIKSVPGVTVLNISKWLNQVSIQVSDPNAVTRINTMPFVVSVSEIAARITETHGKPQKNKFDREEIYELTFSRIFRVLADFYSYGMSAPQIQIHKGNFLHNIGLRGQNMQIGMLDAGFNNYTGVTSLDSLRTEGRILGTWDFVARETSVNEDHPHGLQCLTIIAANIPGTFVGAAPKASFYLYRTEESATEYPIEEHNWVCGAEKLDSAGGDMISSSLGYNLFPSPFPSHTFSEFNGNTTMAAIGADLAAKKGILVVNAAGNEGNNSWGRILTPADGDSVLAVGGVNTSGVAASFTSRGPSSDGQVKPDVASVGVGTIIQNPNNSIGGSNGTSFACPNMAGLTACLWQGYPEFNNMKIINALRQAGSRAGNPNDSIGYGIPDMKRAFMNLTKDYSTASGSMSGCVASLTWTSKDISSMKYEIERKTAGESSFSKVKDQFVSSNIFGANTYTITDTIKNASAGIVTYRIRQIIDNDASTFMADYIDTVSLSLTSLCTTGLYPSLLADEDIVLLPNPARTQLSMKITTTNAINDLTINIFDAQGKRVLVLQKTKSAGTTFIPIPLQQLATGKYYLTVESKGQLLGSREWIRL